MSGSIRGNIAIKQKSGNRHYRPKIATHEVIILILFTLDESVSRIFCRNKRKVSSVLFQALNHKSSAYMSYYTVEKVKSQHFLEKSKRSESDEMPILSAGEMKNKNRTDPKTDAVGSLRIKAKRSSLSGRSPPCSPHFRWGGGFYIIAKGV